MRGDPNKSSSRIIAIGFQRNAMTFSQIMTTTEAAAATTTVYYYSKLILTKHVIIFYLCPYLLSFNYICTPKHSGELREEIWWPTSSWPEQDRQTIAHCDHTNSFNFIGWGKVARWYRRIQIQSVHLSVSETKCWTNFSCKLITVLQLFFLVAMRSASDINNCACNCGDFIVSDSGNTSIWLEWLW